MEFEPITMIFDFRATVRSRLSPVLFCMHSEIASLCYERFLAFFKSAGYVCLGCKPAQRPARLAGLPDSWVHCLMGFAGVGVEPLARLQ